jgi:glycosyltransferase involved in cell wall biosynthesis
MREADMSPREDATVDVGIPTLGNSPYLTETIESVFAQTFTGWRLFISENGPGDAAFRASLEPYLDDPRVTHLVTGTKIGRGANHNNIINAGSAPYVGIVHDDDRWHPDFLARHVAFLDAHPRCGFVFSGHIVIDETGRPLGRTKLELAPGTHASSVVLPRLYRNNFIGCPAVVVCRSAYEAVGAGYPDLLNYDIPMWLRLTAQFDIGCIADWDADYRLHGLQASSNRTRLASEMFPVLDAVSDIPITPSLRRLVRAETHVRCALDAVERGERRVALRHLSQAVSCDPTILVRPAVAARVLTAVGALAGGERGRRRLTEWRERRWRSGGAEGLLEMPPAS